MPFLFPSTHFSYRLFSIIRLLRWYFSSQWCHIQRPPKVSWCSNLRARITSVDYYQFIPWKIEALTLSQIYKDISYIIVESLLITAQYYLWLENDFNEIKLVYDMSSKCAYYSYTWLSVFCRTLAEYGSIIGMFQISRPNKT